eukprot:scaffold49912_cov66-Phaeocystis_antarctica.AAC.3
MATRGFGVTVCPPETIAPRCAAFPPRVPRARAARAAMALLSLSGDEQRILFTQLCNALDPRLAVALSSTCNELRELTQAQLQQLRADHEAAAALCHKAELRSCKELREAKEVSWYYKGLSSDDLALLGTLGSVLPALEDLTLYNSAAAAGPDGVQRLAEGLGAGALPAVTALVIHGMHVGDAGASALAAALGRGALPRLKTLCLSNAAIGDAGLVALAPALRRRAALDSLDLGSNPFGDEGLAALVAPPPSAGAPPPSTGVLTKLKLLYLSSTHFTDAGCATLAAALNSSALPALKELYLNGILASAEAIATVYASANLQDPYRPGEEESESEESGSESEPDEEGEDDSEDGEEDD